MLESTRLGMAVHVAWPGIVESCATTGQRAGSLPNGKPKLLGSSTKTKHSSRKIAVVYRRPHRGAGGDVNECGWAEFCPVICLGSFSGHFVPPKGGARNAQLWKSAVHRWEPRLYKAMLWAEAREAGPGVAIRADGTSDTGEGEGGARAVPECQWYDYTKDRDRVVRYVAGEMPSNYHLTYSWGGGSGLQAAVDVDWALQALAAGINVAVPYVQGAPTQPYLGPLAKLLKRSPIDGEDDARWLDPRGHVVPLKVRGGAKVAKRMLASGMAVGVERLAPQLTPAEVDAHIEANRPWGAGD